MTTLDSGLQHDGLQHWGGGGGRRGKGGGAGGRDRVQLQAGSETLCLQQHVGTCGVLKAT